MMVTGEENVERNAVERLNKRKRGDPSAPELEIDVSAPEPPSKKALRKSKNKKPVSGSEPLSATSPTQISPTGSQPEQLPVTTKSQAVGSIWIGNLPFTLTKQELRQFFTSTVPEGWIKVDDEPVIGDSSIARLHMPLPNGNQNSLSRDGQKPKNKGFAYVDFSTELSFKAALALSERNLEGRKVLIKDAKNFEGRPTEHISSRPSRAKDSNISSRLRGTKRIFVGNLGFDVTKEDLKELFAPCGHVEDVFLATFEDSGKCKGFGWVTFAAQEKKDGSSAAEAAVRGWARLPVADSDLVGDGAEDVDNTEGKDNSISESKTKKQNHRKWFVNRLHGRQLRCEFAEDASIRYQKRYGKSKALDLGEEASGSRALPDNEPTGEPDIRADAEESSTTYSGIKPGAPTDPRRRRAKGRDFPSKANFNMAKSYRTGGGAFQVASGTKIKL